MQMYVFLFQNKRSTKGLTSYFTEPENFTLKPIASSPLDAQESSIMITPSSSPTKQLDSGIEIVQGLKASNKISNLTNGPRVQDEGVFHLDYDSELDLNSIEEDDLF